MKKILFVFLSCILIPHTVFAAAPAAPDGFRAVSGNQKIYLNWIHSRDISSGVLGYKLFMSADGGTTYDNGIAIIAPAGGVLNNFYTVSPAINGMRYKFRLVSYNSALEQSGVVESNVAIPADNSQTDIAPPEDVTGVIAFPGSESVDLKWDPTLDLSQDAIGYKIYTMNTQNSTFDSGIFIGMASQYTYKGLQPKTDYTLKITVIDAQGNESPGRYVTFTTVETRTTPGSGVVLGGAPPTTSTFKDVTSGVFKTAIEYLAARNIVQGYTDGTFQPSKTLNRAEGVTLLMKASGLQLNKSIEIKHFSDVPATHGLAMYIENAYSFSVVNGYSDNTFRPNGNLTRAEFIKMLIETFSKKMPYIPPTYFQYTDLKHNNVFAPWVYAAHREGIAKGFEDGTFQPSRVITRGEAAAMLARLFQGGLAQSVKNTLEELQVLSLMNGSRQERNLYTFRVNEKMSSVARSHAADLAKNLKQNTYIGSDGKNVFQRLDISGILYKEVSENIAIASYANSSLTQAIETMHTQVMSQEDNAPNQKANVLTTFKNFTDVGIGIAIDEESKLVYIVVDFVQLNE